MDALEDVEDPEVKRKAIGRVFIESVPFKGPSATSKSQHNVGELLELGKLVDVPDETLQHQPFSGPGLAIRILGAVTEERLFILRAVDAIVVSEIKAAGLYKRIWQSFAVLLPVKTVGVMGDERTYENVIAIRTVESVDGMTADWA